MQPTTEASVTDSGLPTITIVQSFVLDGFKYQGGAFGTPGGLVDWSIALFNFPGRFQFDSTFADTVTVSTLLSNAFNEWSSVANIDFVQVADSANTDIRFGLEVVDGPFGIVAQTETTFVPSTGEILFSDIYFDISEDFSFGPGDPGLSFFLVATHEIGHAIGLAHEDDVLAVMNTFVSDNLTGLTADDIAGAQFIYGAREISNIIIGDEADNVLFGGNQNELVFANGGNDVVFAAGGSDVVYGNAGSDALYGNQGDDIIFGGRDDDIIFGGQQADVIYGNFGNDFLYGNFGNDTVYGGGDGDLMFGGQDDDLLFGNLGADILIGNLDNDQLIGGPSGDLFVFSHNSGQDIIWDFAVGLDLIPVQTNVNGTGVGSAGDLLARVSNGPSGAVLDLGSGNTVTISGVDAGNLTTADFTLF